MDQSSSHMTLMRAIVRSNKDPEKLGRVQVTYPWFSGNSSELVSDWAQVAMPYASRENGSWFLPDPEDEVLVMLESSNLSKPVIIGTLYSDKNKPPSIGKGGDRNGDGKNALKFIKTRAGNCLSFDDTSGSEEVVLKQSAGTQIDLKKEEAKLEETGGAKLKLAKGKIALGNDSAELFDLLEKLLACIGQNGSTMVSTAVGPGVLNPSIMAKVEETKAKIAQLKGSL